MATKGIAAKAAESKLMHSVKLFAITVGAIAAVISIIGFPIGVLYTALHWIYEEDARLSRAQYETQKDVSELNAKMSLQQEQIRNFGKLLDRIDGKMDRVLVPLPPGKRSELLR